MKSFVKVTLALLLVATMLPIGEAEAARHRRHHRRGGHHGGGCGNGGCYAPVYGSPVQTGKYSSPVQQAPMQAPVQKGGYEGGYEDNKSARIGFFGRYR